MSRFSKALCFIGFVLLCLYAQLVFIGGPYGLNENAKLNTRLQYGLRPSYFDDGWFHYFAITDKDNFHLLNPDTPVMVESDSIIKVTITSYYWDNDSLLVECVDKNGVAWFLIPQINAEDYIDFVPVPEAEALKLNPMLYTRISGNESLFHSINLQRREYVVLLLIDACLLLCLFLKQLVKRRKMTAK